MQYIGFQVGLAPDLNDSFATATATSIVLASEDIRNKCIYKAFRPILMADILQRHLPFCCCFLPGLRRRQARKKITIDLFRRLECFESLLRRRVEAVSSVPFFVAGRLTYADVSVFDSLSTCLNYGLIQSEEIRTRFPLLWLNFNAVGDKPGIRNYVSQRGGQLEYFVDRIKFF